MGGTRWTQEEDDFLREWYPRVSNAEITRMMNERGWKRGQTAIHAHATHTLHVSKDVGKGYKKPGYRTFWTHEREAWLRDNVPGRSVNEVVSLFEKEFGEPIRRMQVKCAMERFGVKSGVHEGRFKKGHVPATKGLKWDDYMAPEKQEFIRRHLFKAGNVPHKKAELLDEKVVIDKDGKPTIFVNVAPRNAKNTSARWISKGRFEWMRANGRDFPEGHRVVYADHDRFNCDPDNLVAVPEELFPLMNGANSRSLPYHDRETLEIAILSARVTQARGRVEREAIEHARPREDEASAQDPQEQGNQVHEGICLRHGREN